MPLTAVRQNKKEIEDDTNYYRLFWLLCFFSFFLRARVGKQRVESEVSIGDKVDKMEMDTVNYGYRPEALYTSHV